MITFGHHHTHFSELFMRNEKMKDKIAELEKPLQVVVRRQIKHEERIWRSIRISDQLSIAGAKGKSDISTSHNRMTDRLANGKVKQAKKRAEDFGVLRGIIIEAKLDVAQLGYHLAAPPLTH
jgi:hypothetical protein